MKYVLKDRVGFIVAFVAILVGVAQFESILSKMHLDFGFYNPNLFQLLFVICIMVILSVYSLALDNLRSGLKYQNSIFLRYWGKIGVLLFVLALLLPIFFIMISISNLLLAHLYIQKPSPKTISNTVAVISAVGIIIFLVVWTSISRKLAIQRASLLGEVVQKNFVRALELYDRKFYSSSIIEFSKVIELILGKKLEEKGLSVMGLSWERIVDLAIKNKIIDDKMSQKINNELYIRDQIIHLQEKPKHEDATSSKNITERLLSSFDKPSVISVAESEADN